MDDQAIEQGQYEAHHLIRPCRSQVMDPAGGMVEKARQVSLAPLLFAQATVGQLLLWTL